MQQTKIWDYFQNNPDVGNLAFNAELRYQYLADRIQNGMNVLDIGVGRGGLERLLVSKGVNVYCLDPNKESIDYLRAEFDLGDRARVGFSQEIPFENERFDVVIMSEVLEHLSDKKFEKTLEEVCRVLRPGGKFIGTVPATEDLLVSRVVCPDCAKVFHRWGHVQSFSQELLKARFASFFSGETVIKRVYLGSFYSLNWKGRVSWVIKKIFVAFGIEGTGENFFFSVQRPG